MALKESTSNLSSICDVARLMRNWSALLVLPAPSTPDKTLKCAVTRIHERRAFFQKARALSLSSSLKNFVFRTESSSSFENLIQINPFSPFNGYFTLCYWATSYCGRQEVAWITCSLQIASRCVNQKSRIDTKRTDSEVSSKSATHTVRDPEGHIKAICRKISGSSSGRCF